jgi:hypothetical protein
MNENLNAYINSGAKKWLNFGCSGYEKKTALSNGNDDLT